MPRWVQIVVFAFVIGIILFLAVGLRARGLPPISSGPAPDLTLKTFDGQTLKLSDLRGKVVVVNFWASWCDPCSLEAAFFEKTWRAYKDRGVVFLGVNWVDSEANALAYLKKFNITYPNGPDLGSAISQSYRIKAVPETYFVGKDGNVQGNALGPITPNSAVMTEKQFVQKLEDLLAK